MPGRSFQFGIGGLLIGMVSSVATWQLFAQNQPRFAENIPLSYLATEWSLAVAPGDPSQVIRNEYFQRGARRSDGSYMQVTYDTAADGSPFGFWLIEDLQNARSFVLDTSIESVTTSEIAADAVYSKRFRREGCYEEEVASTILGYEVIRRTREHEWSDGRMLRVDELIAPALGCLPMESQTMLVEADGTEETVRYMRVLEVEAAEPENSLFEVPDSFQEKSPIERLETLGRSITTNLALEAEYRYELQRPGAE